MAYVDVNFDMTGAIMSPEQFKRSLPHCTRPNSRFFNQSVFETFTEDIRQFKVRQASFAFPTVDVHQNFGLDS
jgi:hypothetical protein